MIGAVLVLVLGIGVSLSDDAHAAAGPPDVEVVFATVESVSPDHGPCAGCCGATLNAPCSAESFARHGSTPAVFVADQAVDRPEDARLPDGALLTRILRPPKS